jgi:hypothetical protein
MQNRLAMLDALLHHTSEAHFFDMIDTPILALSRELLRWDTEKIRQLFGVIEPEKMRESSRHEHCKGDAIAFAKRLVKNGEKPEKFLRPHGMILLFGGFRIFMEDNP